MKRIVILAGAIMMVAATYAQKKACETPFERVSVNVPAHVRFVQGETYSVNVRSVNSYEVSAVRWEVKDGMLKINSLDGAEISDELCITIVSPSMPALSLGRDVEIK